MRKIDNKLFADYMSNHIMMTYPWMHQKYKYYNDLVMIYKNLFEIFAKNNIKQTLILPDKKIYDNYLLNLIENNVDIIKYTCNDIWIRDYYPKFYFNFQDKKMIKYNYNGYGKKYAYSKDNNLKKIINSDIIGIDLKDTIIEGGNLEFSSKGVLLTNKKCLVKNNIKYTEKEIIKKINIFKDKINLLEIFMIDIDPIAGDDTNGHIDNLVRFIDDETIVYFASDDKEYINYGIASQLKEQIQDIFKKSSIIKNIVPIFHSNNDLLIKNNKICPYSKLNFIATNNCYIFPSIGINEHDMRFQLDNLNLDKKFYLVNSETSLLENGGLHCLTTNI